MSWGIVAGVGGAIGGALINKSSADKATDAQVDAANQDIAFQRETRDLIREDQEPYRKAGNRALEALMSLTGLAAPGGSSSGSAVSPGPTTVNANDYLRGWGNFGRDAGSGMGWANRLRPRNEGGPVYGRVFGGPTRAAVHYNINELAPENYFSGGAVTRDGNPRTINPNQDGYVGANTTAVGPGGFPNENPGGVEGGYKFQTDPGYQFRFSEGMRALDRGGAAAGGLLSGGYGRRAIRYGQDYASNEYTNVYNRIANIAGLGQTANQANTGAALQTAAGVSNALGNQGYARASGYTAQGNAWGNAINQIGQLDWGSIFNRNPSSGTGRAKS